MQTIRRQQDLAILSKPRFIYAAPTWLRRFAIGILVIGAFIGSSIAVRGIGADRGLLLVFGGLIVVAICISVLVLGRPNDWRVWINLAATRDGLYLVARARRVVFVPWPDVIGIDVEQKLNTYFARLTLRLPEKDWAQFGNTSAITGTGAVRQYLVSAIGMQGGELVDRLKAFRDAHA